jgi:putative transposase
MAMFSGRAVYILGLLHLLGFKSFEAAQCTLAGIELMHMLKKKQLVVKAGEQSLTAAEQFYALAS